MHFKRLRDDKEVSPAWHEHATCGLGMSFRKTKRVNKTISYNRPRSLLSVQLTKKSDSTWRTWSLPGPVSPIPSSSRSGCSWRQASRDINKDPPQFVSGTEEAKASAKIAGPKLIVWRKGRAPISPGGALARVLSFLPKSLVEKINDLGHPMSRDNPHEHDGSKETRHTITIVGSHGFLGLVGYDWEPLGVDFATEYSPRIERHATDA
jgi:hypothetical protein